MLKSYKIFILAFELILFVNSERVSYKGYKLYEVYPRNKEQAQYLQTQEGNSGIHFLSHILHEGLNAPVNVLVSPNAQDEFGGAMAKKNIGSKVVIENFERTIERERMRTKRAAVPPGEINFNAYHRHDVDRLWRKTRSKGLINCTGTDANRNFDLHWGEEGDDLDQCSDTYRGPYAFSEPETRAFRDLVLKYASQIKLTIDFHSFGQLIMYPWSYTTELPPNAAELCSLGSKVATAIEKRTGTSYAVDAVTHILYYASGSCTDWIKGVAGVNLTYIIELPPPSDSMFEFKLPSKYIKEVVSEIFEGVKVFQLYVENMFT